MLTASKLFFYSHLPESSKQNSILMNPRTDKLVRRTTMVATATASYFLLTADYGAEPNALDPVTFCKEFIFGSEKDSPGK
ncbi:hypothetical protein AAG906_015339 [Vitis piasezkii]